MYSYDTINEQGTTPSYLLPPPVATLVTVEWVTLMMYAMGWIMLILMSHTIVLVIGAWIGSSVIPWLRNRQELITDSRPSGPRVTTDGPHESAASADQVTEQRSACATNSPLPKSRSKASAMQEQWYGSAPNIFEDGSNRFHISSVCKWADTGMVALPIMHPCSKCTNSGTFLNHDVVYCCMKGKKYHIESCCIIKSKQDSGPNESRTVRSMTACRCVTNHYLPFRSEGHNYKVF